MKHWWGFLGWVCLFMDGLTENRTVFRRETWLISSPSNPISVFHQPKCSTECTRTPMLGAHLWSQVIPLRQDCLVVKSMNVRIRKPAVWSWGKLFDFSRVSFLIGKMGVRNTCFPSLCSPGSMTEKPWTCVQVIYLEDDPKKQDWANEEEKATLWVHYQDHCRDLLYIKSLSELYSCRTGGSSVYPIAPILYPWLNPCISRQNLSAT